MRADLAYPATIDVLVWGHVKALARVTFPEATEGERKVFGRIGP